MRHFVGVMTGVLLSFFGEKWHKSDTKDTLPAVLFNISLQYCPYIALQVMILLNRKLL